MLVTRQRLNILAAVCATTIATAAPALADAINGDWCNGTATMHIDFPGTIRIPSGKQITGECWRHACRYTVPAGDKDAGSPVLLRLIDELTMEFYQSAASIDASQAGERGEGITATGPAVTWKRCQPVS